MLGCFLTVSSIIDKTHGRARFFSPIAVCSHRPVSGLCFFATLAHHGGPDRDGDVPVRYFCAKAPGFLAASLHAWRVLLWGASGVGKSTLAATLVRDWSRGACWVLREIKATQVFLRIHRLSRVKHQD